MSAGTTPYSVKNQSNEMKLVLTKDNRVAQTLSSSPQVTKPLTHTRPVIKSVIREPIPKRDPVSPTNKPIVVPSVPKLFPTLTSPRIQPHLNQFFPPKLTSLVPHTNASSPPTQTLSSPSHKHKIDKLLKKSPVKKGAPVSVQADKQITVDDHPPKPKKPKTASVTSLPLTRVKTIMKTDIQSTQTTVNTGQESVAVVAKAAELFIAELARRSVDTAREQTSKGVTYSDLAIAVQKNKDLHFLHAVVPKKVLARDCVTFQHTPGDSKESTTEK